MSEKTEAVKPDEIEVTDEMIRAAWLAMVSEGVSFGESRDIDIEDGIKQAFREIKKLSSNISKNQK